MKALLFIFVLFIVLLSMMTSVSTKRGGIFKLLLRVSQMAGIAANTSPGPR